jgi:hypothetical protein
LLQSEIQLIARDSDDSLTHVGVPCPRPEAANRRPDY